MVVLELQLYAQCRSKEGSGQAIDKLAFKQLSETVKQLSESSTNLNYAKDNSCI